MNMVQQMMCRKDFVAWCKQHRIPASKYYEYGKRVFVIFQRAWEKTEYNLKLNK